MPPPEDRLGFDSPYRCDWCGGDAPDAEALEDHRQWCLGDGMANVQMLSDVGAREGELTHEALVAEARRRRHRPRRPDS